MALRKELLPQDSEVVGSIPSSSSPGSLEQMNFFKIFIPKLGFKLTLAVVPGAVTDFKKLRNGTKKFRD